jgi:hypothetical protein
VGQRQHARFSKHVVRVAKLAVESRDSKRLMQHVMQAAAEGLHVEQVAICLLDETGLEFRLAAASGLSPGESIGLQTPYRHERLAHDVVVKRHALVVTNDRGERSDAHASASGTSEWRSALAVPLFDGRRVIGAVAVGAHRTWRFDHEDVRFLETLASLLAASLQRERSDRELINARDAMLDGGTLSFRAWPVNFLPSDSTASRPCASDLGCVAISVNDTGTGMSDAVKQHALEPFFTTMATGRGTGLGLSTVFGFMEQSHGALVLDSAPGKGTTITLFLPQHGVAEAGAPAQPHADELVQDEDRRIDRLALESTVGQSVRRDPGFCQGDTA